MEKGGRFVTMIETVSVKIDKSVVDKVRKLREKDRSINIGGFISQAALEKLSKVNKKRKLHNDN